MPVKKLVIARGHSPRSHSLPAGIDFVIDEVDKPVCFWHGGCSRDRAGAYVKPIDALSPHSKQWFEIMNALWFVPILERLANGENVAIDEIMALGETETGNKIDIIEELH